MPSTAQRAFRLSTLCAAMAMTGAAFTAQATELDKRRADIVRAQGSQPLADARTSTPQAAVAAVLRARGRDAATLATMHTTSSRTARGGVTHLRLEQKVQGLDVYGAYVKVAIDRNGGVRQVIDRLAAAPAGRLPEAQVDAAQALRTALDRLYPGVKGVFTQLATSGNTTQFDGGAFFDGTPSATAVAVPLADGRMTRGWLVETWTARTNRLHHTLIGGDGRVLNVELRTQTDSYNIFPNDPSKTPQQVVSGPGAGNAQSPAGWLQGRSENSFRISGNNVNAYLDTDNDNRPDGGGTTIRGGNFLAMADLTQSPAGSVNKAVAVQNLFYLNNLIHDILYSHGFDEAAGNFQNSNFGQPGSERDAVNAEAQDGGGLNNANFATPPDGRKPRMQMYLWSGAGPTHELAISSPVAVSYPAASAQFGPVLNTTGLVGSVAAASPADGCTASGPISGVAGKIALIDRGTCAFVEKALNAQAAGAIGMVVANNTGGTAIFGMGGTNAAITIPSVMISQNDGAALRLLASPSGAMRALAEQPLQIDASLDSDIVYHEYGHGLTWRMIGSMGGIFSAAIGEGASDTVAMLVNGDDRVAEYSASNPVGIRRFPYAGYPLHYGNFDPAAPSPHPNGEIYAATMWRLIELFGPRRSELFTYFVDGMNYTPSDPAYEDMRDGMLQAVANGPAPSDRCTIWTAFAQFGIGVGASGTVGAGGTVTVVPSFTKPADCN